MTPLEFRDLQCVTEILVSGTQGVTVHRQSCAPRTSLGSAKLQQEKAWRRDEGSLSMQAASSGKTPPQLPPETLPRLPSHHRMVWLPLREKGLRDPGSPRNRPRELSLRNHPPAVGGASRLPSPSPGSLEVKGSKEGGGLQRGLLSSVKGTPEAVTASTGAEAKHPNARACVAGGPGTVALLDPRGEASRAQTA